MAPAPPVEGAREDLAASSSTITADRTPRSAESLPQLLSELPGVSVTRLGGLASTATLSLRGSSANQVQVYFDGVPLSAASGGGVDIGLIPLAATDRVEVYRGSSPIGFGASGMGGIVSLTSPMPERSEASAYVGGGSFATGFAGARAAWAGQRLRLSASAGVLGSAGDFPYPNDHGTVFNSAATTRRQNNALAQLDGLVQAVALLPGRRRVRATASLLDRYQGVPQNGTVISHDSALHTRRVLATAIYESRDDLAPGGKLRAQLHALVQRQQLDDPLGEVATAGMATASDDLAVSYGATLAASRPAAAWLRLSGIVDGRVESFSPSTMRPGTGAAPLSTPPGRRSFAAGGGEAHLLVSALALDVVPSIRLEVAGDHITRPERYVMGGPDTADADYLLPCYRLALVQRPTGELTLRANAGHYGRLPSTMERYGNTGLVKGNPDLMAETGENADLGAAWQRRREKLGVLLDGALFGALTRDLILFRQAGPYLRPVNIGRARILGLEASGRLTWSRHLRAVAQGTFTDARNLEEGGSSHGRQLPLRPRLRAYGRPELRALPLHGRWRWGLYLDVDVTGGNHTDPANLVALERRVLWGAGGHVEAPHLGARVLLSALNLTNSPAVDLIGYPMPGRSLYVTLQWSTPSQERSE